MMHIPATRRSSVKDFAAHRASSSIAYSGNASTPVEASPPGLPARREPERSPTRAFHPLETWDGDVDRGHEGHRGRGVHMVRAPLPLKKLVYLGDPGQLRTAPLICSTFDLHLSICTFDLDAQPAQGVVSPSARQRDVEQGRVGLRESSYPHSRMLGGRVEWGWKLLSPLPAPP